MRLPNNFRIDNPSWAMVRAGIAYWGVTSAAGAAGGTTLICADLDNHAPYLGHTIKILTGDSAGQEKSIQAHAAGGVITPDSAFTDAAGAGSIITAGTEFCIKGLTGINDEDIIARGTFTLSDLVQPEDNTRTEGNGFFKGNLIMPTEGACANQARLLTSYTGVGGVFDIDPGNPFSNLPGLVDYVIIKFQTPFAPPADAGENRLPADTIGHKADTAVAVVNATSSIMRYVKGILNAVGGASLSAVFQEKADVPVDITAINGGQTDVFHLNAATTRYLVRSLRLKCADPGANTVSVRLYRLINDGLILVDTFEITTLNFNTHYSLMDMFGVPYLAGDELQVTVQVDAGGPYAVIGQYSHATAT